MAILDLLIAYALALPVGWERERHERSAGLRTFPLVAVASCGFVIVASRALVGVDAQSRVIQGLIGGIGFIGAGTILRVKRMVHGTATAASLLVTGIIGISVAYHYYDIAVVLSIISLVTLRLFQAWKHPEDRNERWTDRDSSE
jgi:putative Mg2+ transporter-C (MgtC) family protein